MPPEIQSLIASDEKTDFTTKAERLYPRKSSIFLLFFSLFWTALSSLFAFFFFSGLFLKGEVEFKMNGVPTVATWENLTPLLVPALMIGAFLLIGIALLAWSLYMLRAEGPWFVGTSKRLIQWRKGTMKSMDWEQFNGIVESSGTNEKGSVSLQLRTGRTVRTSSRAGINGIRRTSGEQYVPDTVEMVGIANHISISEQCRKRILENDPTPPSQKLSSQPGILQN